MTQSMISSYLVDRTANSSATQSSCLRRIRSYRQVWVWVYPQAKNAVKIVFTATVIPLEASRVVATLVSWGMEYAGVVEA